MDMNWNNSTFVVNLMNYHFSLCF